MQQLHVSTSSKQHQRAVALVSSAWTDQHSLAALACQHDWQNNHMAHDHALPNMYQHRLLLAEDGSGMGGGLVGQLKKLFGISHIDLMVVVHAPLLSQGRLLAVRLALL